VSRNLSSSQPGSSSPQRRTAAPLRGRRLSAAAAALLAVPLAAGCAAGFNATTQQIKPNSGSGAVGGVKVNNVWVIVDPNTGNAEVIGAVANTNSSTDTLTGVTATNVPAKITGKDAAESTTGITVSGDSVTIPGQQSVSFGQPGRPDLELPGAAFQPGLLSQVTFTFAQAGSVTVTAQIQANSGLWASYNPNSAVTPTAKPTTAPATPTGTATATGTATPGSTATGASATATATHTS
jgi:hypothetical protein